MDKNKDVKTPSMTENDGQPEKFHVTEPVQYHIYYKSKKQAKHVFNVNYKVEA